MTMRFWFKIGIFLLTLGITGRTLEFLCSEKIIRDTLTEGINYDVFRELKVSERVIEEVQTRMEYHPEKEAMPIKEKYMDVIGYLTSNMLA